MIDTLNYGGRKDGATRQSSWFILLIFVLVFVGAVGFAVSAVGASNPVDGEATGLQVPSDTTESAAIGEQASQTDVSHSNPILAETNASVDGDAYYDNEWGIVPEDGELEENDGAVDISITAQDLGADPGLIDFADGEITSFMMDVQWDYEKLELTNHRAEAGIISQTPEEDLGTWKMDHYAPGRLGLYWDVQVGFDDIIEQLFGDGEDVEFPEFEDDPLVELTFEPTEYAEEGDTADVQMIERGVRHGEYDEPTVWGGQLTSTFSQYDTDNIWWGSGEIDIVPESVEPAIEGADGTFTARSTGGYIDFGQHDDPGENEDTLATFPNYEAGEDPIIIEGDFRADDGKWKADPADRDIVFPIVDAGDSNADTEVAFDEPIGGTIDLENETMTFEADTEVIVDVLGEDFHFEFATGTNGSGELEGKADFEDIDADALDGSGELSLVDNQFVVIEEEQDDVDQLREEANLERDGEWVADQPGENYIVFDFDIEIEEFSGVESTLAGAVVDDTGDPIENASITIIESPGDQLVTDGSGTFELGGLDPGTWDIRVNAEGYHSVEETITFEPLETVEQTFELQEAETNFDVEMESADEIAADEFLAVRASVENTQIGAEEQSIELVVDGETVDSKTVELGEDIEDGVTPDTRDSSTTVDLEWTPEQAGEFDVEVTSDDDSDSKTVEVIDPDEIEIDALVDAELQQGSYVAFGVDSLSEAEDEEEHILLPPQESGDDAFTFRAQVTDGAWSAGPGDITFPEFTALDFGAEPAVPLGLDGTFDHENEMMTLDGEFEVDVPDVGATLIFDAEATTDESGEMSGSATVDEDSGTVTLVANDFEVGETGADVVDDELEPPVPAGDSYLMLVYDLEIQDVDGDLAFGDVAGVVTDETGDPVEGATVSVEDAPGEVTTDDDGAYLLDEISTGEHEIAVKGDAIDDKTVSVTIEEDKRAALDIEVAGGEPEFNLVAGGDTALAGDSLSVSGTVENVGAGPGTVDISLRVETEDGELLSESTSEATIEGGDSTSVTDVFPTTEEMIGAGTVILETADQTAEDQIEIQEPIDDSDGPDALIELVNTGDGYISFDEEGESDAIEEGLKFPSGGIIIEGEVYGDQWQATAVQFPTLEHDLTDAEVDAENVNGNIDVDAGTMTLSGDLEVEVALGGDPFGFDMSTTSEESGALQGTASLDEDGGSVTLVDNEYTITDQTDDTTVDGALGLPLTEPGLAWLELGFNVEIQEIEGDGPASGSVAGTVSDESGEPINDAAINVVDELQDTSTNGNGAYDIVGLEPGSYDLEIEADGFAGTTVAIEIIDDETTERDIKLEAGDAEFDFELDSVGGEPGDVVTATATISNTGDGSGTESVTVSIGESETSEELELVPGEEETVTAEWQTEEGDTGEFAASLATADEETIAESTVQIEKIDNRFVATGQGGFVAFDAGAKDAAREEGIQFPTEGDNEDPITIVGEINDDGTWEASADHVGFPILEDATPETDAAVRAPNGLSGEIDEETGEMTIEGELEVEALAIEETFTFDIAAVTGSSGALDGEAAVDGDTAAVTVVDNEYVVEEAASPVINDVLGLRSDSGESWFELALEIDLDADDDATEQAAESTGGSGDTDDDAAESEATFLTSVGLLGGLVGVGAAITLVMMSLFARIITAVDPDPGP